MNKHISKQLFADGSPFFEFEKRGGGRSFVGGWNSDPRFDFQFKQFYIDIYEIQKVFYKSN